MKLKFKNCKTGEIKEIDASDFEEYYNMMIQTEWLLIF